MMNYFDLKKEMIFDSMENFLNYKNISNIYIKIDESDEYANQLGFEVLTISYFDHFLNENEYVKQRFVSYSSIYNNPDYINEIEDIFNKFAQIFSFIYDKNNGDVYAECCSPVKVICNKKIFVRNILNALKERPIGMFVFPNLCLTLSIGYDFTHSIYINNHELKQELEVIIKKNNIFILE